MALRNLTPLIQSKSFKKLWNLGQTSAGFCLAKGKKYMEQLCDKSTTLKKEYVCHSLSAQFLFKGLFIQCIVTGSIHEMQSIKLLLDTFPSLFEIQFQNFDFE